MSKELAIITIHGMGKTERDYFRKLENSLKKQLNEEIWKRVHLESVYYQDLLQDNQDRVWHDMPRSKLDWKKLRQFMLFAFSDAATLEHMPNKPGSVYKIVQQRIIQALQNTRRELGNSNKPIVIVAQSLGGQVISNYIWDIRNKGGIWEVNDLNNNPDFPQLDALEEEFVKLKSLRYLFTTGCNIPLFVAGFDPIDAIEKPNSDFQWLNYYDEDDVLGWPLKTLSPSYNKIVKEDILINSGGGLTNWNPFSHNGYWTDKDFVANLSEKITNSVDLQN